MKKLLLIAFMAIASACLGQSSGGNRGTATPGGGTPSPLIVRDQAEFGVLGTTKWIGDGSITSGSAVMTCPNADCAFTQADVGKVCFATQVSSGGNGTILPTGTISVVTDATHATCNGGNATGTNNTTAFIVWGPDDTAAMDAADQATFQKCQGLKIHGLILVKTGKFRTFSTTYPGCSNSGSSAGSSGGVNHALVEGNGQINTYIIPTPDFNFSTCNGTGIAGLGSCFGPGGTTLAEFKNFTIDGFYSGSSALALSLFSNSYITYDFVITAWCINCASSAAFTMTNQQAQAWGGGVASAGLIACYSNASQVFLGPNWACEGTQNFGLQVGGGQLKTIDSFFSGATNAVQVLAGTQWMSDFDEIGGGSASPISNAGTVYMQRFNATNVTTASWFPINLNNAASRLFVQNSNLAPASGAWVTCTAGARVFDQGGNVLAGTPGGTCAFPSSQSIAGTACVAGNFAFTSGWGTSAITGTPVGDAQYCAFAIQTTVNGTASPVLTYTFPTAFTSIRAPNCILAQVGGTFTLSNPSHVITTTTDTITFTGTPTATQTYNFVQECH